MDSPLVWIILVAIAYWSYKSGKRTGSRKGYNVGRGRRHGQNRRW